MSKTLLDCVDVCGATAPNKSWRRRWPICRWVQMAEPLAVITDHYGLVTALRRRITELGTGLDLVDEVAGLPDGYTGKVLVGRHGLGPISLGAILGALAVKIVLVSDEEALARVRRRLPPRGTRGPKLDRAEPGVAWMGA